MDKFQHQKALIRHHFETFLQNRYNKIVELELEELNFNPFLIGLYSNTKNLDNPKNIIERRLSQNIERGESTSFGSTLKNIASVFLENTNIKGVDGILEKNGNRYLIKINSGPNTLQARACKDIAKSLNNAVELEPNSFPVYCMCFGTEKEINSKVKNYIIDEGNIEVKIGRDFWSFISGYENCYEMIFNISKDVGEIFEDENGQKLSEIIQAKENKLINDFKDAYGDHEHMDWHKLLN